jgi:flagellar hook-associated protein 2
VVSLNLNSLVVDKNGRVSFSGLSSGIDFQAAVDAIIAARQIPADSLKTTIEANDKKVAALKDLRSNLDAVKQAISKLYGAVTFAAADNIFEAKQGFATTSRLDGQTPSTAANLLGVSVTNAAAAGSHTIEIRQTAKAHKVASDKVTSLTTAVSGISSGDRIVVDGQEAYRTSLQSSGTVAIGSNGTLSFTRQSDGASLGTVAYTSTTTLQELATAITANITGYTGTVVTEGSSVRLEIKSSDGTKFTIAESGGGSFLTAFDLRDKNEVTLNSTDTIQDIRDRINNAKLGVSASIATVTSTEHYLVLTKDDTGQTMTLKNAQGTALQSLGFLTAGNAIKNELQAAQKANFYADGLLDQTKTKYETSFQSASTVQVGSSGTLRFTRDSDSVVLGNVNYSSTDSLQTLANNINAAAMTGVTASIVTDGAGVRLEVSGASAMTISETGAGSAITTLDLKQKRRLFERESNTVSDMYTGVTFSLFQAEKGTTVKVDIERNLSSVKTQIESFVEAYNKLRSFINEHRQIDTQTGTIDKEVAVLYGSAALSEADRTLSRILGTGVQGVDADFSVLAQIGVTFVDNDTLDDPLLANTLQIDSTKLDDALLNNDQDVRKLFAFDLAPTDPRVTLLGFDGYTTYSSSGYTLNIQPNSGSNMLARSEEFDNAYWSAVEASLSANTTATAGPDGRQTADGVVANSTNTTHEVKTASAVALTSGTTYTYSIYAKKGDRDEIRLRLNGGPFSGTENYADFNLNTGTVSRTGNGSGIDGTKIESVGNGWYRISVTATAESSGSADFELIPKDTGTNTSFAGNGSTVNTYIWGAQLHSESTGSLVMSSLTPTRATVGSDVTTAPDSTATADSIIGDATNNTHYVSNASALNVTSGETYTYTAYVKAAGRDRARLELSGSGKFASSAYADFNLASGTVVTTGSGAQSATITDAGSGWYRVTVTAAATGTGTAQANLFAADASTGTTYTGDGATADIYFWQPKVVSSATKAPDGYIAATTAAVSGVTASANIGGASTGASDGSATLSSGLVTVASGGAQGLRLATSGFTLPTSVQLNFTVGIGTQMFFELDALLNTSTGTVENEINALTDQNELNQTRVDDMLERLEQQRQDLLDRFVRMETALATANRILDSISQITQAMFGKKQ